MGERTHLLPVPPRNPPVRSGDVVLDVGCRLTQIRRAEGIEKPPERVRAVMVFDWGLRVCAEHDYSEERPMWDCEWWDLP